MRRKGKITLNRPHQRYSPLDWLHSALSRSSAARMQPIIRGFRAISSPGCRWMVRHPAGHGGNTCEKSPRGLLYFTLFYFRCSSPLLLRGRFGPARGLQFRAANADPLKGDHLRHFTFIWFTNSSIFVPQLTVGHLFTPISRPVSDWFRAEP